MSSDLTTYQKRAPVPLSVEELDLLIDAVNLIRPRLAVRERLAHQLLVRFEAVYAPLAQHPNPMKSHHYDLDSDRCACGGEVVWFEAGDADGDAGEGCEVASRVWSFRG
jgi:hypothetical protein